MIEVTKKEKKAIIKNYPNVHIKRTVKGKSKRHHYYCEESSQVVSFLKEYRDSCRVDY